VHKATLNW